MRSVAEVEASRGQAGWRGGLKRLTDVVLSLGALVVFGPFMVLIALVLLAVEGEPVLFRQERVGRGGRVFGMYKFRTMPVCVRKPGEEARHRPAPAGKFLRLSGLDELPQLVNVLKGDMSLVGPRPEQPELVEEFTRRLPAYPKRHEVAAGITGWAQVNGFWGATSLRERLAHDLEYVRRWSLGFDMVILWMTVGSIFRRLAGRREPAESQGDSRPRMD